MKNHLEEYDNKTEVLFNSAGMKYKTMKHGIYKIYTGIHNKLKTSHE